MLLYMICNQIEVIRKGGGDHLGASKLVTMGLLEVHDDVNERLKYHQEDTGAIGSTLVYSLQKFEHFTNPLLVTMLPLNWL